MYENSIIILLLWLLLPCFSNKWLELDVKKLTKIIGNHPRPLSPQFSHNLSACIFRFHDPAFVVMKNVTLNDADHFKARSECSVQFFNLPRGILHVKIISNGEKNSRVIKSCDEDDASKPSLQVFEHLANSGGEEIGHFCYVETQTLQRDARGEDFAAKFQQNLTFLLHNWEGNSVFFRYKPFRLSVRHLYESNPPSEEDHEGQKTWLLGNPGAFPILSSTLRPLSSNQEAVNTDYQFPDDCKAAGKFVCQQSVKCADEDADYFVCKKKKFLCLNTTFICDGKPDCMPHDSSDENCKGQRLTESLLIFLLGISSLLCPLFLGFCWFCNKKTKRKRPETDTREEMVELKEMDDISLRASVEVPSSSNKEMLQNALYPQ